MLDTHTAMGYDSCMATTTTFEPVSDTTSTRGFYNDAEAAATFAKAETKRTGRAHMVSSVFGTLCPSCATAWMDSPERLTLTVEATEADCYNCHD